MKKIFFLVIFLLLASACTKVLPQPDITTQTGDTGEQETLKDIQLEEVSEQTGISPVELGELMNTETESLSFSEISIEARGTEPFWYFTASGSSLIWQAPGELDIETETFTGISLTSSGTSYNVSGGGISALITLGACSDGMSDLVYDYSANVTKGATNYNGCANVD